MKTPKIPKGWHKLRNGKVIHNGDKEYIWGFGWRSTGWAGWLTGSKDYFIRRNRKPAKPHAL